MKITNVVAAVCTMALAGSVVAGGIDGGAVLGGAVGGGAGAAVGSAIGGRDGAIIGGAIGGAAGAAVGSSTTRTQPEPVVVKEREVVKVREVERDDDWGPPGRHHGRKEGWRKHHRDDD